MESISRMAGVSERPVHFSGSMVRAILETRKTQMRQVAELGGGRPMQFLGTAGEYGDPSRYGFDDPVSGIRWRLNAESNTDAQQIPCPYGKVGDRLWVQESGVMGSMMFPEDASKPGVFRHDIPTTESVGHDWVERTRNFGTCYKVAGNPRERYLLGEGRKACPSIYMPRWASRILLEIAEVRLERLQNISERDAVAEGIRLLGEHSGWLNECTLADGQRLYSASACDLFRHLWDEMHATRGYAWDRNPWVWVVVFQRVVR